LAQPARNNIRRPNDRVSFDYDDNSETLGLADTVI
jgi:hypothetical protein